MENNLYSFGKRVRLFLNITSYTQLEKDIVTNLIELMTTGTNEQQQEFLKGLRGE